MNTTSTRWVVIKLSAARQWLKDAALASLLLASALGALLVFIILGPIGHSHRMRFVRFLLACGLVIVVGLIAVIAIDNSLFLMSVPVGGVILIYVAVVGEVVRAVISRWYEPAAPNSRLTSLTRLFSPIEIELIFNPIHADWEEEYSGAYKAGRIWTAISINLKYRFRLLQTVIIQLCNKLITGLVTRLLR